MISEFSELLKLPNLPLTEFQKLPAIQGIYFCISEQEVLYIGVTTNLNKRWHQHHKALEIAVYPNIKIYWLDTDDTYWEKILIQYWYPKFNIRPGYKSNVAWLNRDEYLKMLSHPEFTAEVGRVFCGIIPFLYGEVFNILPFGKIGQMLNMSQANVQDAAKALEKIGILQAGKNVGNFYEWRIHPNFYWKQEQDSLVNIGLIRQSGI